jgi:hypothetical protein
MQTPKASRPTIQYVPFIEMTAVAPGSTSASVNPASAPLVTVPRKRALAQMVVRVSKIFYLWFHMY